MTATISKKRFIATPLLFARTSADRTAVSTIQIRAGSIARLRGPVQNGAKLMGYGHLNLNLNPNPNLDLNLLV
jgi:hypothetical protein